MTLNVCQVGHDTHESKLVQSQYGPFHIWDWEKYQWQGGYCTGQDEVSKSIDINGYWEKPDTDEMLRILGEKRGLVMDFGSHIGWFAVLAAAAGNGVYAYDSDPENSRLLSTNYGLWTKPGLANLAMQTTWVADIIDLPYLINKGERCRLVKVDVEGREHEVLALTRHLWQERRIDYGLWELSPIFENREGIMADSYSSLVDEIASYGYRWYILKDEGRWYITGDDLTFPQENAWAEKLP